MEFNNVRPILRMFDYKIDWEYTFEKNTPIYMQLSLGDIQLHLSEHHGDCSPGAHIHINCVGIKEFHKLLIDKNYKYNKPGLARTFYDTWSVTVNDPVFNKITFNELIVEIKDYKE